MKILPYTPRSPTYKHHLQTMYNINKERFYKMDNMNVPYTYPTDIYAPVAPAPAPVAPAPVAPAPAPAPAPVQNCGAVAYISGYVNDVYNGKKYTYVTVRVVAENGNYTNYKIAFPIGKGNYQLGTYINVNCTIKQFYDKTNNCFITAFYAY